MPVDIKSLSSVANADAYFNNRLYSQAWTNFSADDKQRALNQATLIINGFNFVGMKTQFDQDNEWPRSEIRIDGLVVDSTLVPDPILIAQYEIALSLAMGIDPEREIRNLRVTSRGYSSVRTTYDPRLAPEHLTYGVPSALAWSYLSTYLNRGAQGGIKIHRVS